MADSAQQETLCLGKIRSANVKGEMAATSVLCSASKLGRRPSLRVLVLLLLAATLPVTAQQSGAAPPPASGLPVRGDLHRAETVQIHSPGPTAVVSNIKCGPSGGIYTVYNTSSREELREQPIRRVSASSQSVTEYPIPAISGYKELARVSFDVTSDGTLYELVRAISQSESGQKSAPIYLIVKYKDDGSIDAHFELDPGKDGRPMSLAVFADGHSLVSGTTLKKTPDGTSLGVFSAMFDPSGAFGAPVRLMKLVAPAESGSPSLRGGSPKGKGASNEAAEKEGDSADPIRLASGLLSVSSSDGNVYVLQSTGRLSVVSAIGSVEHQFALRPPANGLTPLQMAAAGGGFLFVFYGHLATGRPGESAQYRDMVTVVDSRSGEVTAIYSVPQAETDFIVPACAASPTDFVFLNSGEQDNLEIVHYVPN